MSDIETDDPQNDIHSTATEGELPFLQGNNDPATTIVGIRRQVRDQVKELAKLTRRNTRADSALFTAFGAWVRARIDVLRDECVLLGRWRSDVQRGYVDQWKTELANEATSQLGRGWSVTTIEARLTHAHRASTDPNYWRMVENHQLGAKQIEINVQDLVRALSPTRRDDKEEEARALPTILDDPPSHPPVADIPPPNTPNGNAGASPAGNDGNGNGDNGDNGDNDDDDDDDDDDPEVVRREAQDTVGAILNYLATNARVDLGGDTRDRCSLALRGVQRLAQERDELRAEVERLRQFAPTNWERLRTKDPNMEEGGR